MLGDRPIENVVNTPLRVLLLRSCGTRAVPMPGDCTSNRFPQINPDLETQFSLRPRDGRHVSMPRVVGIGFPDHADRYGRIKGGGNNVGEFANRDVLS